MKGKRIIAILAICALFSNASFATAYDLQSLKAELYQHVSQFDKAFKIEYKGNTEGLQESLGPVLEEMMKYEDNVYYNLEGYHTSYLLSQEEGELTVTVDWQITLEQELAVNKYVKEQLLALNLDKLSDYQKVYRIADFIADHFTYDDSLVIHDISNMIDKGVGVCQAYSLLFYKMATAAGLEVDMQDGTLEGTPHLWNAVKINENWYHVDVTNYDALNKESLVLVGSNALPQYNFVFDKPIVDFKADTSGLDKAFVNGRYDPALIDERLKNKAFAADLSGADYKKYKTLDEEKSQASLNLQLGLDLLLKQPTKILISNLERLIRVADQAGVQTFTAENQLNTLINENQAQVKAAIEVAKKKVSAIKGKQYTEKSALAALAEVDKAKTTVGKINLWQTNERAHLTNVTNLGREASSYLIQYYMGLYHKTKLSSYLNKAKAINGKYGIVYVLK